MEVLTKDLISSESSGEEELEDGFKRPAMEVKPLSWRGAEASHFFSRLDRISNQNKCYNKHWVEWWDRLVKAKASKSSGNVWGFQ